jgi:hypothetical protein
MRLRVQRPCRLSIGCFEPCVRGQGPPAMPAPLEAPLEAPPPPIMDVGCLRWSPPVTLLLCTLTSSPPGRIASHHTHARTPSSMRPVSIAVRRFHCTRVHLQLRHVRRPWMHMPSTATLELRASLGTSMNFTGPRCSVQRISQWIDYRQKSLMAGSKVK